MMRALLAVVLVVAGCAQTPAERAAVARASAASEADFAKLTAGLVPGRPQMCLDRYPVGQIAAYGGALVYRVSPTLVYRSDTGGGCERVARGDALVTVLHTGRPCAGDIARTLDPTSGMQTGSCSFGDFVAYRKP